MQDLVSSTMWVLAVLDISRIISRYIMGANLCACLFTASDRLRGTVQQDNPIVVLALAFG